MKILLRILAILLVAVLIAVGLLTVSLQVSKPETKSHSLTIMTWNTHCLGQYKAVEKNEVVRYLREHPADVICLQECDVRKDGRGVSLPQLKRAMKEQYPYSYYDFKVYNHRRQYGNIVYSRYPLVNKQTIGFESRANISSRCDIVVEDDTLRLYINHLESNRLEQADMEDAQRISEKMNTASSIRWEQAKALRRDIDASPHKAIVAGDLNTIALTPTYLYIRQGLQDCYLNGCTGKTGNTCYLRGWGVRIDYILADRALDVTESHVDNEAQGSDHYPVWTTLTW